MYPRRIVDSLKRHAWWLLPAVVVAVVVGFVWAGGIVLVVYAIANAGGTWLLVDSLSDKHRRWMCWATIALLPVGLIFGVIGSKSKGRSPSDLAMSGSADEILRGNASGISHPPAGGPAGRSGLM